MTRLAVAAVLAVGSFIAVARAATGDFSPPSPAQILEQFRRQPPPAAPAVPVAKAYRLPDERMTPGKLCTADDPNFQEYRYAEQIPYCRRNVPQEEKRRIADAYGVAWETRANYEFDHRIPLCMGGGDDDENIWPQPLDEAHVKDRLEDELCQQMRAGTLRQNEAVARMLAWPDSAGG